MRSHRHIYPIYAMGGGVSFSPLDFSPLFLIDLVAVEGFSPDMATASARRETEGDEIDLHGYNPLNPRQYKTSATGAYETTESLLYPSESFFCPGAYDQSWTTSTPQTISGWINSTSIGYETLTQSGDDITSAINTADAGLAYATDYFNGNVGDIYEVKFDFTYNSGTYPTMRIGTSGGVSRATEYTPVAGANTAYLILNTAGNGSRLIFVTLNGHLSNFSAANITYAKLNQSNALQPTASTQPEIIWEPLTYDTELDSGNLTIGKIYEITAQTDADFTTDGAPDSNVGTVFYATGTNVTLDAGDKVKEILTWDYPIIKPDGVDDSMTLILTNSASDYSLFIRTKQTDSTETLDYILDIQTGVLKFAYPADSADTAGYYDSAWRTATLADTDWANISMILEASNSGRIQNEDSVIGSSLAYTQKAIGGTVTIFSDIAGANSYGGMIKSLILFPSALTVDNISEIVTYYA